MFETRLGCLQEDIPPDTLRFITAVNEMLTLSETVLLLPRWSRGVLPFWRRFVQAWDDLYDVGMTREGPTEERLQRGVQTRVSKEFCVFPPGSSVPRRQQDR